MAHIYKASNAGGMSSLAQYVDMLAGNPAVVLSSYDSIATVTVGSGGSSSIVFSSIPQTYKHLQIRGFVQTTRATYPADLLKINTINGSAVARSHVFWKIGRAHV